MGKCVFCSIELPDNRVIEICDQCGISMYGAKTFKATIQNMEQAKIRGDLDQGFVE